MAAEGPSVPSKIDLGKKYGPLPLWGYGAVAVGGYFIYKHFIQPANAQQTDTTGGVGVDQSGTSPNYYPGGGGAGGVGGGGSGPALPPTKPPPGRRPRPIIRPRSQPPPAGIRQVRVVHPLNTASASRSAISTFSMVNRGSAGGGGVGPIHDPGRPIGRAAYFQGRLSAATPRYSPPAIRPRPIGRTTFLRQRVSSG